MQQRKPAYARRRTVQEDWISWLPPEKLQLFESIVHPCEAAYAMLSVTLDDALACQAQGCLVRAHLLLVNSEELLDRMTRKVLAVLTAISEHGRHFGTLYSMAPLNPEFFRGKTAQRAASWNALLSHALLSHRSRLFHKIDALSTVVEQLAGEYHEAAEQIAEGLGAGEDADWDAIELLHYDVNTCLRETVVVLKSFLRALPEEELTAFQTQFARCAPSVARRARPRVSRASS